MAHVNPIQIQKFLKGVDYPASKAALIENARNMGADDNVCASLEQLPEEDFQTPADVSQAFGKIGDGQQRPVRQGQGAGGRPEEAAAFLGQAAQDSLAEIELCEMALQKTENDDVKMFAQRMIDEHGQMGSRIEQLAAGMGIDLPKQEQDEDKSVMQQMEKLSGAEFDRKFMEHNVEDHEKDVKVFQHYADTAGDEDIRKLARDGAARLREHLKMAQDIVRKLKA